MMEFTISVSCTSYMYTVRKFRDFLKMETCIEEKKQFPEFRLKGSKLTLKHCHDIYAKLYSLETCDILEAFPLYIVDTCWASSHS